jgi:hypothetical protein
MTVLIMQGTGELTVEAGNSGGTGHLRRPCVLDCHATMYAYSIDQSKAPTESNDMNMHSHRHAYWGHKYFFTS